MTCEVCDKRLVKQQNYFCSHECKWEFYGRSRRNISRRLYKEKVEAVNQDWLERVRDAERSWYLTDW